MCQFGLLGVVLILVWNCCVEEHSYILTIDHGEDDDVSRVGGSVCSVCTHISDREEITWNKNYQVVCVGQRIKQIQAALSGRCISIQLTILTKHGNCQEVQTLKRRSRRQNQFPLVLH